MTQAAPDSANCPGSFLHVGCGGDPAPEWTSHLAETRLDIDPGCSPDVVASMTDLGQIGPFDMVGCCHALEHLTPEEVPTALSEFLRVLKPGGCAVVIVPDLEDVKPTEDVLIHAPVGPITGLDMIYGYRPVLATMPHMAHRSGWVAATLAQAFRDAGFVSVLARRLAHYNLICAGLKP